LLPHSKAEKDGPYAPATAFHLIDWRTCAGHGARAPWSGISCPFLSADVRGSCGGDLASLQAIKQSVFEARNLSHDKALARRSRARWSSACRCRCPRTAAKGRRRSGRSGARVQGAV